MRVLFSRFGLRTRIAVALALASAGTAVVMLLGALWFADDIIDRANRRELRGHYDALQSLLLQQTRQAAAMSAVVASMPPVQQAMARGDRAALLGFFGAGFASLKADWGTEQFQFHTAPATSFLRVHQPEKFGDDLAGFRKTVVQANAAGKPVLGLEGGVAGLGIRGVVPIVQAGKPVGSVEFGLSFGQPFFEQFKHVRHVDVAFHLLDKDAFKTFGGTLNGRSLFDTAAYRDAVAGAFAVRHAALDGASAVALLGPIVDFSGKPLGVVELVADNADYDAAIGRARLLAIAAASAALLIASLFGWLIARGIARPILAATDVLGQLAGGNLAVTVPAQQDYNEVSRMARAMEVMRQGAIEREQLAANQQIERERAESDKRTAMVDMADNIENQTKAAIALIGRHTDTLAASAEGMRQSAERTGAAAQGATEAADEARSTTRSVAEAADQLAISIREISGQVAQSTDIVARAVTAGADTRATIETLNQEVARIGAVAGMIGEIASRTNLLALNATIEAARAGDAGKGFAVVASEVKQLATQTARSTEEIGRHIERVRAATVASVTAVSRIEQTVSEINAISGSIAAAVEEQGAATAEIARNVAVTASASDAVTTRITEVSEEAVETGRHALEVGDTVTGLADSVHSLRKAVIRMVRTSSTVVDRRHQRRRPTLAEATITASDRTEKAIVRDLSERGCLVEAALHVPVGQRLEVMMPRFNQRASGHVAFAADDMLHIAFDGDGLASDEVDRISRETVADMVAQCKEDHLGFVATVETAVAGHEHRDPTSLPNPHHCRLGRWYDAVTDPATQRLPAFEALNAPHQAVHEAGRRALTAITAGDSARAEREVAALHAASTQVQAGLDALGHAFPATLVAPAKSPPGPRVAA